MKKKPQPESRDKASNGYTFLPRITENEAKKAFTESIEKKDSGGNCHLAEFVTVTDRVLELKPSFQFSDIVSHARAYDIPLQELRSLFEKWKSKMVQMGVLHEVEGCYNDTILIRQ